MRVGTLVVVQTLAEGDNQLVADNLIEEDNLTGADIRDSLVVEDTAEKDNHLDCILVVADNHRNIDCWGLAF